MTEQQIEQKEEQKEQLIRVKTPTWNLVMRMKNKERRSADEVIKWMWGKMSHQAMHINRWKKVTGCRTPEAYQERMRVKELEAKLHEFEQS